MAFAGHLPGLKRFVKGNENDHEETPNPFNASRKALSTSNHGIDARKVYEEIIGDDVRIPQSTGPTSDDVSEVELKSHHTAKVQSSESEESEDESEDEAQESKLKSPSACFPQRKVIPRSTQPTPSSLMRHAESNDYRKVMEALNQDMSLVNSTDQFGWSLLMVAACAGAVEVVELLLNLGADVKLMDRAGNTCASLARKKGHLKIVQIIKNFNLSRELVEVPVTQTKRKARPAKPQLCTACNTSIDESQKRNHLTSTVHQMSQCSKECKTYYSINGQNRGYQLMLKNGWDGEKGLGPAGRGVKLPPKTTLKRDRKGLGASKSTARITHFQSNDVRAVAVNNCLKRHTNRTKIKQQIQHSKMKELSLRRELS